MVEETFYQFRLHSRHLQYAVVNRGIFLWNQLHLSAGQFSCHQQLATIATGTHRQVRGFLPYPPTRSIFLRHIQVQDFIPG